MTNYYDEAKDDASGFINNFQDELVESLMENGEVPTYHSDINESYVYESCGAYGYSLRESAELLDQLDEFEADDSGMWDGQSPRDAVSTMATFTYQNAVSHFITKLLELINDNYDLEDILNEIDEDADENPVVERKLNRLIEEI